MYNYFMLIGIVYKELEVKVTKNGKRYVKIPLLVARSFKNPDGQYDADLFHIYFWESLIDFIKDNIKKGQKIGAGLCGDICSCFALYTRLADIWGFVDGMYCHFWRRGVFYVFYYAQTGFNHVGYPFCDSHSGRLFGGYAEEKKSYSRKS